MKMTTPIQMMSAVATTTTTITSYKTIIIPKTKMNMTKPKIIPKLTLQIMMRIPSNK